MLENLTTPDDSLGRVAARVSVARVQYAFNIIYIMRTMQRRRLVFGFRTLFSGQRGDQAHSEAQRGRSNKHSTSDTAYRIP